MEVLIPNFVEFQVQPLKVFKIEKFQIKMFGIENNLIQIVKTGYFQIIQGVLKINNFKFNAFSFLVTIYKPNVAL